MTKLYTGHEADMAANEERKLTKEEMQAALLREIKDVLNNTVDYVNRMNDLFSIAEITEEQLPAIQVKRIKRLFELYEPSINKGENHENK